MKTQKLLTLFILLSAGSATSGWAQTITWTGAGGADTWSTADNWSSDAVPSTGENILFTGSTPFDITSDSISGLSVGTITFDSTAAAYSISTDQIKFTAVNDQSANTETFNNSIALTGNRSITVATGGTLVFNGVVSGTGFGMTLAAGGGGTLILNGVNTYTGTTTVNTGTLLANGTSNGAANGATGIGSLTVGSATLGGSGIINPSTSGALIKINNGGVLAPGTAGNLNTLTIAASATNQTAGLLTLASGTSGASLAFNLGAGNTSSLLSLTGTFAGEVVGLSGNNFNFTDLTSGHLSTGLYTLISTDSTASVFSGLSVGNLSGFTLNGLSGDTAQLQLNLVNGDETLQLDITSVAAVPEPGTWALLVGGIAILLMTQRRRFKLA